MAKLYNLEDLVEGKKVLKRATAKEVAEYISTETGKVFNLNNINSYVSKKYIVSKRFRIKISKNRPCKSNNVTEREEKEILQLYADGMSATRIGMQVHRAFPTVKQVLVDNGVALRNPSEICALHQKKRKEKPDIYGNLKIEDYGKLQALWNAGWCVGNIALEFGCKPKEVIRCLKMLEKNSTSYSSTLID